MVDRAIPAMVASPATLAAFRLCSACSAALMSPSVGAPEQLHSSEAKRAQETSRYILLAFRMEWAPGLRQRKLTLLRSALTRNPAHGACQRRRTDNTIETGHA